MAPPLPSTSRLLPRLAAARAISSRPHHLPPPSPSPAGTAPTSSPQAFHAHLASLVPHVPSLLAALSRARAARLPLLPATRALAASALLRHGRLPDALAHFSLLPNHPILPAPLCNSLLAALASSGSLAHARKVLDRMLAGVVELDTVGFGVFIKAVGRRDGLAEVMQLVEVVGGRGGRVSSSVVVAMVVDGMCREGRIEDAWRALEEMRLRGWKPDFVAYRIVSEGFRIAGRVEEEGRILKQKRKLGVAPRKEDYREHVLALVSNRQITEAKEIAEAVVLGDFPIDDDVLNVLIGSVSGIDADAAAMFCKFMTGKGKFPSTEMLVHLCENLFKNRKGDEMWEIFRVLLENGYCKNSRDYHLVVSFLGKAGKVREAYDVLKQVKRKRLEPDISSYNSLMDALCRNDLLRPAKKLWDEMFTIGCSPNLQTYNILITKFAQIGESEEVQQLCNHMFQKGVAPDAATYTSFITMLCEENKYEQAMDIFKKSLMQDAAVASSVLTVFILALCKQGNFKGALSVMCCVGSNAENLNSHVILLKSLTDAGKVEMAIEHIKWIRSNCSSSLHNIINELMASLSTSASLQHVTKLIQYLYSQRLVDEADPWMKLMGNVYA
ncbi:pentatricopeptide repeat-containing protein At5g14080-like [Phragmites australis]|uniref:pentatricopeptide repeat-containing protein At5g14080-like n=1 Tax=Phragmites australis TaxID=29695 RepID=UPI002D7754A1|nr:pentatricopeptide repeat-containing protein At5g14080-like [Phragmites australis]XP_062194241.1 pentatricopeptide repeat-containing protein At5g14080-like [Phragmites australis]XP_062194242.1 pentatricopeptide repeat-containing protein At5g14080-like [Phragmites australis]XP_062194243.1 pentatricopeptide repeat-containing protein At5g14080-like [Phragmites australis]XP_062194244.1 pentatricopeptide repeat-containing protein At5g14080-like [Phragmites australis]XP_062194245.1 pentatricopepti